MGSGSDSAIEAADLVFLNSSVEAIPKSVKIARKVLKEPEKKSLEALCGYFQIDREHAHRRWTMQKQRQNCF